VNADLNGEIGGYRWTNHPLVDMGIASLMVFSGRNKPEELSSDDLEDFAKYAEDAYFSPELASYLTVLFTSNFINPSFKAARKKEFVKETLRIFNVQPGKSPAAACVYCNRPSIRLAHRDLVPMLTSRDAVNFYPGGAPGLALCGYCILALQALTIGAPMCAGRALVVSCDNSDLTLQLIRKWQPEIRRRIQLSQQTNQKIPPLTRPLTRTVEALSSIQAANDEEPSPSITVHHFSNSGQGPQVDLYFLPGSVVRFLDRAKAARYSSAWNEIVHKAWELPSKPQKGENGKDRRTTPARNYLYEDLFTLPDQAERFVRTYFLRKAARYAQGAGDPRPAYSGWRECTSGLWDFTTLFLTEIMAMDKERISAVKKLGDCLAEEIAGENDRGLWWKIYSAGAYRQIRFALIQAGQRRLKRGSPPVVSFDEFLRVFEEGDELPRVDWRLAWDLVLIRVMEVLHQNRWFESNMDALEQAQEETVMKEE
jgi:CRISPR-associated protein Cst1